MHIDITNWKEHKKELRVLCNLWPDETIQPRYAKFAIQARLIYKDILRYCARQNDALLYCSIDALTRAIEDCQCKPRQVSARSAAWKSIMKLLENDGYISVSGEDKSDKKKRFNISYIARECTLDDDSGYETELGDIIVTLRFDTAFKSSKCEITASSDDPVYDMRDGSYFHPHISSAGRICFGEFNALHTELIECGMLWNAFELTNEILHTYGDSPYVPLSNWHGKDCEICGRTAEHACEECGKALCERHARINEGSDYAYCAECVTRCVWCEEYVSISSYRKCTLCGGEMCDYCHDEHNGLCSDCTTTCENCAETVRKDDTYLCDECGIEICTLCKKRSEDNHSLLCSTCKENEDEANTVTESVPQNNVVE